MKRLLLLLLLLATVLCLPKPEANAIYCPKCVIDADCASVCTLGGHCIYQSRTCGPIKFCDCNRP